MVKNTPSSPSGALSPSTLSSLESLPFEQGTVSAPPDGGLDVSRLAEDDPLATQMWKYFARAKTAQTGPHAVRMENLSWRMGGMKLEQIRSQQELRQHTASPSQSPFMSLDGYSIFTSITTTSPHDNIDHNYNNTDDPIPIHPDLHPSYASERPRGRDRQPRAYTSSSASTDTRDETYVWYLILFSFYYVHYIYLYIFLFYILTITLRLLIYKQLTFSPLFPPYFLILLWVYYHFQCGWFKGRYMDRYTTC